MTAIRSPRSRAASVLLPGLMLAVALVGCVHGAARTAGGGASEDDEASVIYARAYASSDPTVYREAKDDLASWLSNHADTPDARIVRLRIGKLQFALGELRLAAESFEAVAFRARTNDHLSRGALRNEILALKALLASGERPEVAPAMTLKSLGSLDRVTLTIDLGAVTLSDDIGKSPDSTVSELESALTRACDRYVESAPPEDPEALSIRLIAAELLFRHGKATEASERCAAIVNRWPATPSAEACVRATIDALNLRERWAELEQHARAFRGNRALIGSDLELERQLDRIVQGATFKRILSNVEDGVSATRRQRLLDGARAFEAFQREFPYSDLADKALYNAFVYLIQADRGTEAVAMGRSLVEDYASSPLAREARRTLKQLDAKTTAARAGR